MLQRHYQDIVDQGFWRLCLAALPLACQYLEIRLKCIWCICVHACTLPVGAPFYFYRYKQTHEWVNRLTGGSREPAREREKGGEGSGRAMCSWVEKQTDKIWVGDNSFTSVCVCVRMRSVQTWQGLIIIVKLIIPHLSLFKFLSGYRQRGQVRINECHPHIRIHAEIKWKSLVVAIMKSWFFLGGGGLTPLPHSFLALYFSCFGIRWSSFPWECIDHMETIWNIQRSQMCWNSKTKCGRNIETC